MFIFPKKTEVNKELSLLDVFKQIKANEDVRVESKMIDQLFLSNVLNERTLDCISENSYKEVYIFKIFLNKEEIPLMFIESLDKVIMFHTYFMLYYQNKVSSTMAFKSISNVIKLSKYYSHDFENSENNIILTANSVQEAYKMLYSYEVNIKTHLNETIDEFMLRVNQIHKLQYQITKIEQAIIHQIQPKRKYEYHIRLLEFRKELKKLTMNEE